MVYRWRRDLKQALELSGLEVIEIKGWRKRGRPRKIGDFNVRGVLCHHTGSDSNSRDYAEWMFKVGRDDLPAPLVQLGLDRQGRVYLGAAGRSNHAGWAKKSGPMPDGDGNTLYIGIEAFNTGSEGWTKRQYRAYVKLCAALCRFYDWPASHVRAHRETSTTGKWDPGKLEMGKFRDDVAAEIRRTRKPTRVQRARRLLRKALQVTDSRRRKRRVSEALEHLPKR